MLSRVGPPPLLPLNSINTAQGYTPIVQPYSLKGKEGVFSTWSTLVVQWISSDIVEGEI